jgi:hypothetical protein
MGEICEMSNLMTLEAFKKDFRRSYLPTRNPADARRHGTNLPLMKAASAESDDITRIRSTVKGPYCSSFPWCYTSREILILFDVNIQNDITVPVHLINSGRCEI